MSAFRAIRCLSSASLVVLLLAPAAAMPQSQNGGKGIFLKKKCAGCHSVEAAGIPKKRGESKQGPPDLSATGSRHSAEFLSRYLRKNDAINGKKHLLRFTGTQNELDSLARWLESLTAGSKR